MARIFETGEITKLLDVLIGKTEAVGETNEDERRLDNLKTLIDVTNWCLDGLQFAMASGYGRPEYSMAEIRYTAQCALDEYGRWIADVLDEQITDRKTEPTISKMEQVGKPQANCGDFADRLAYERGVKHAWEVAQKVFNSTVTFYEAEDVAKQIDKDINVRSKDEAQTDIHGITDCDFCKHGSEEWDSEACDGCCNANNHFEPKDEPQTNKDFKVTYTCSFTECDNFKNFGFGEKCIECKRKQSEAKHKDEPQTYITEDRDTQILDAWQVHHRNTTTVKDEPQTMYYPQVDGITPSVIAKDEPQTDCAWK